MSNVLLYDCDGVFGDTEQDGHQPASKQMWTEFGVPWSWSAEGYGRKLAIGGGRERMKSLLPDDGFLAIEPHPGSEDRVSEIISNRYKRKSENCREITLDEILAWQRA